MFDKRLHRQKRPFELGPEAALINTFMNTFESPLSSEQKERISLGRVHRRCAQKVVRVLWLMDVGMSLSMEGCAADDISWEKNYLPPSSKVFGSYHRRRFELFKKIDK